MKTVKLSYKGWLLWIMRYLESDRINIIRESLPNSFRIMGKLLWEKERMMSFVDSI